MNLLSPIMLTLVFLHIGFFHYWATYWSRFNEDGVHRSTAAMKKKQGWIAVVACTRLVASAVVLALFHLHPQWVDSWKEWAFAALVTLHGLYEAITATYGYVWITIHPSVESGLYHRECARDNFVRGLQNNDINLVRLGIEGGADIDKPIEENGELTPLIYSATKGYDEICRLLLEAGADPNQRGKTGYIALCEAIINPRVTSENRIKTLALLLKHGADVNVTFVSKIETTPLIHAAMKGYSDVCRLLLESKADPNQRNRRGHLALTEMIGTPNLTVDKRIEIAELLLNYGANPRQLDWGRPSLHYAIASDQLVSLLLKHGADINQPSDYHEISAPRKGQNFTYDENTILWFIKWYVNMPIAWGRVIAETLLNAGADPLQANSEGYTAWDFVNQALAEDPNIPAMGLMGMIRAVIKRLFRKADHARHEAYVKLLKPVVMAARFDLFVSSEKYSGWGEFYRGRLEQTGKRIWSSDLLKRQLPGYEEVMEAHIADAPAAVLFLSHLHFSTEQGVWERKRELDALVKRFSSMPEKLLIVTTSEKNKYLLTNHSEMRPFPSIHFESGKVNELWAKLSALCGLYDYQAKDAFHDLRQITIPLYDCFVSYRTDSVHTVRFLAEQLVARGAKLWFAEWEIRVSGRRGFQEAINQGIASSRNIICYTNAGYAHSEYCQIEAMQVLDVPGKENRHILDLRMPEEPNVVSAKLQQKGSSAVIVDEQSLEETWSQCCEFLRIQKDTLPKREMAGRFIRLAVGKTPFHMEINEDWSVIGINHDNIKIANFIRKIDKISLECLLTVGPWHIDLPDGAQSENREMFDAIIEEFNEWNRDGKIFYPRGVHVVHVPALHNTYQLTAHPAFTYLDSGSDVYDGREVPIEKCTWHRKYIIRVTPPHMPSEMEFCFDFDMRGVAHDDFATFCRYAYLMDDLVRGLRFG